MPGKKKPSPHLRDESTWLTRYHSASWKTGTHGYGLWHIPCHCNGRLPARLLAHGFSSRLREDFQPFLLTRLTLFPGSLAAARGLLVPIIAFRSNDVMDYAIETADGQDLHPLVYWREILAQEIPKKRIPLSSCLILLIGCNLLPIISSLKSHAISAPQAEGFAADQRLARTIILATPRKPHSVSFGPPIRIAPSSSWVNFVLNTKAIRPPAHFG